MRIAGLQRLTLLDFPGRIACTVFLRGCNLRCPFCHNASLVRPEIGAEEDMEQEALLAFLRSRRGMLDGVCITGGEPTLSPDLPELIGEIRALGFALKLDTNGTNPRLLASLLDKGLLDYVAMDVKNSPARYGETCGKAVDLRLVEQSISLLRQSGIGHEFRTTLCHPLHTEEDMRQLGIWLSGDDPYYLQQFVDSGDLLESGMAPLTGEEMERMRQILLPYLPNTALRGV